LFIFCDASEKGIGTSAYVGVQDEEGKMETNLLCSKTNVAPLPKKTISIPRLELMAALKGAQMGDYIVRALRSIELRVYYLSDSRVALGWIKGDSEKQLPFVGNKTRTIKQLTSPDQWYHCPGIDNPADLASRGVTPGELVRSPLWWHAPPWISLPTEQWPSVQKIAQDEEEEVKKAIQAEMKIPKTEKTVPQLSVAAIKTSRKVKNQEPMWRLENADTFTRLVRVTAWVTRYVANLKKAVKEKCTPHVRREFPSVNIPVNPARKIEVETLDAGELEEAELKCIRWVQMEGFPELYQQLANNKPIKCDKKVQALRPQWDPVSKIIRVTGRIEASMAQLGESPRILLPPNHRAVYLLINRHHCEVLHAGLRATLSDVREKYWIIRGRQQVLHVLHRCVKCKKLQSLFFDEVPAALPASRVTQARPFEIVGVDFAGPLYVLLERPTKKKKKGKNEKEAENDAKNTKGKTRPVKKKVYLCLFTCAVTRALYIVVVPNLSASMFVHALRRLFSDFGRASVIYSDNATTFKKTKKYLRSLQKSAEAHDFLANNRVKWRFSASLAPWWGGWWERMVRTTKNMLRKMIGRAMLTIFELDTIVKEISAAINDRPITFVSDGLDEPSPLTPNHLIYGRRLKSNPEKTTIEDEPPLATRDELILSEKRLTDSFKYFWKRWLKEYLQDLDKFHASGKSKRQPKVGEVVMIHDEDSKRVLWKIGLVTEHIVGRDGKVRAVWLRTSNGSVLNRPIQRLYPLEILHEMTGNQKEKPRTSEAEPVEEKEEEQRPVPATDDPQPAIDKEEPMVPSLDPGTGLRGRRGRRRGTRTTAPAPDLPVPPQRVGYLNRRGRRIMAPNRLNL